jgi:general secretion pathway protein D
MLKVDNRETAIIGGLMQDQINKENRGIPILSSIPLLGALFSYAEEKYVKSELVIFIRPVVIESASLDGDLADYKKYLLEDLQQETSNKLSGTIYHASPEGVSIKDDTNKKLSDQ